MRVIEVKGCAECPYFELSSGFNRVYLCRHPKFKSAFSPFGRIKRNGSYPQFASWRVAQGCPLKKVKNGTKTV